VSAADVLSGDVPFEAIDGKIVLVGASALGTRENVTTPLDTLFTGIEVQATAADNLLSQDFVSRPEFAVFVESLVTLVLGVAMTVIIAWTGPLWGSVVALVCLAAPWATAVWALSATGAFLSPVMPTLGCIVESSAIILASVASEQRRANSASTKLLVTQRLMVQSLLSLTEMRDTSTGLHSRRTHQYARLLAERLAAREQYYRFLTPERIELLATLAPLHDIGKVGIPDRLLNKPALLTSDEIEEMRKHPTYGRDVILSAQHRVGARDDDVLQMAKDIVYTHHERWDGRGYPQGLTGEQIPIPGRVVMLVDVYDALTSPRVYRAPMEHDAAVRLIAGERGTHFDPAVVDAFLEVATVFERISREMRTADSQAVAV
jgi:adenylate cyclase